MRCKDGIERRLGLDIYSRQSSPLEPFQRIAPDIDIAPKLDPRKKRQLRNRTRPCSRRLRARGLNVNATEVNSGDRVGRYRPKPCEHCGSIAESH